MFHLSGKRRSKCEHRPEARRRRYTPFDPHVVSRMPKLRGLSAAVLPPPQFRTPMFVRHSCRFATQNRAPGRFEGQRFWRFAREGRFDVRHCIATTTPLHHRLQHGIIHRPQLQDRDVHLADRRGGARPACSRSWGCRRGGSPPVGPRARLRGQRVMRFSPRSISANVRSGVM